MWSAGLDRRALAAFLAAVLVQLAMAVGTWSLSGSAEQAADDVSARYKALHAARLLEAEMADADRDARASRGDVELSSAAEGEWADVNQQRALVDARLHDGERDELDASVTSWRAAMERLRARDGDPTAEREADQALDDVITRIDHIADREEAEILEEEARVGQVGWCVRGLTIAGDTLSITLVVGSVALLQRDAVRRRAAEAERERLIGELQQALAEVHQLTGMLPICAWCKKIRDDAGYWSEIESYIAAHSEAEFTHGICPECKARVEAEMKGR